MLLWKCFYWVYVVCILFDILLHMLYIISHINDPVFLQRMVDMELMDIVIMCIIYAVGIAQGYVSWKF